MPTLRYSFNGTRRINVIDEALVEIDKKHCVRRQEVAKQTARQNGGEAVSMACLNSE